MRYYAKAMDILRGLFMVLVSIGLVIMIAVTSLEVVRRYVFGLSFSWSEELVKYLMIMVAFLGGAVAFREGGLVALDIVTAKLPEKLRIVFALLAELISVVVIILLFYLSFKAIMKPGVYKQISIGLGISMAYAWVPMPVGFGAMLLFSVEHFGTLLQNLFKKEA